MGLNEEVDFADFSHVNYLGAEKVTEYIGNYLEKHYDLIRATNGEEAVSKYLECNPDIILMDIDMPGTNGIEGVRIAKAIKPKTNILMFTVFDDDKKIFDALCAGADGYLLKKTPPEKLIEALKAVYQGEPPSHRQ